MILLDTNVISEVMRPTSASIVLDWLHARSVDEFATTAITRGAEAMGSAHPLSGIQRAGARPLTSAPASGDILRKNGTDNSEIIATPTKTG